MRKISGAFFVIFAIAFAGVASAQVKDQAFQDWTVFTTDLQGKKTCYIASFPKSQTGNFAKRSDPYFLVTKVNKDTFEVSTSSGYKYKDNSDVKLDIQGNKFNMFTKGELAWAPDGKQDAQIVDTIKKKGDMEVRGTSGKGTYSVDKYSLSGFSAAYKRMNELCD